MTQSDEGERLLQRIELASAVVLISFIVGAAVFFSWNAALGVLLGGGIVIVSFHVLKWQLRRSLQRPGKLPGRAAIFFSYYLRFLATLFVVFLVMYLGLATPLPVLVGLSVMIVSIVLVGAYEFITMKKEES